MSDLTFDLARTEAQLDELEKIALGAQWGRRIGAGVGALTGGLVGRQTAPEDQRTGGMIRGALIGAGVGVAGGQVATSAGRKQVVQFGQRQLHGTTGYLPGHGIFGNKGLPADPKAAKKLRIDKLKEMAFTVPEKFQSLAKHKADALKEITGPEAGFINRHMPMPIQKARAFLKGHQARSQQVLAEEDMTSLPGLAKAYVGRSPGKLAPHKVLGHNLMGQGIGLGVALPAAMSIPDIASYTQTGDESQLGTAVGSNIGYGLAGALPMGPLTLLGQGMGYGGRLIGRAVGDRGTTGQVVPNPQLQER